MQFFKQKIGQRIKNILNMHKLIAYTQIELHRYMPTQTQRYKTPQICRRMRENKPKQPKYQRERTPQISQNITNAEGKIYIY